MSQIAQLAKFHSRFWGIKMGGISILNNISGRTPLILFANQLETCLSPIGTLNLLAIAIRIAPREETVELMSVAIRDLTKGQPTVPFFSLANEAKDWVSWAGLNERKHYAAAILNSFTLSDKVSFYRFVEQTVAK